LVLKKALEKAAKIPLFPPKSKVAFPKLKFWESLHYDKIFFDYGGVLVGEPTFASNTPIPGNRESLERIHINHLLEEAVGKSLIYVTAGAGYGKTQAVYSFVQRYPARTAWMQMSEKDNNAERFWENFIFTVMQVNPDAGKKLQKMSFPDNDQLFERYLKVPKDEVVSSVKYIFVYDDVHLITNKPVLRFLERSFKTDFPSITSIVISRNELPFNFMNIESKGKLARITEEDLRFSYEELTAFLSMKKLNLPSQTLADIYRDTEGWAFAIHLVSRSLKNSPVYVPSAMKSNIFKLIESEIIAGMSPGLRKFFISLSLVDHFSPDLLNQISGSCDFVEAINNIGSFIRFDIYHNSYRIHRLLLDYLETLQHELSEDEKREVYAKAAAWCAANNQKMDALAYYEKGGDYRGIIEVSMTMPLTLPLQTAKMLLGIFDRAPKDIFKLHPTAYSLYIGILMTLSMFDRAAENLHSEIDFLESSGPPDERAAQILTGAYIDLGFLGFLTSVHSKDYSYIRFFEKACEYSKIGNLAISPTSSVLSLSTHVCLASTAENGEMIKFNKAIEKFSPLVADIRGGCCYGEDDLAWAELAFFKNRLHEAEELSLKAVIKAREKNQYEIENRGLFYLLRIKLCQGDIDSIENIKRQLEAQMDKEFYLNRYIYYDMVVSWFYTQLGQSDKTAYWIRNSFEERDRPPHLLYGMELIVKVKYLISIRNYHTALALLKNSQEKYSAGDSILGKLEKKTIEAVSRYRVHDNAGAFHALEEAWKYAEPESLVMPFIELGKDMRTLIEAARKENFSGIPAAVLNDLHIKASLYAKKIFSVSEKNLTKSSEASHSLPGYGLSHREMNVLKNLSEGLTREEIAKSSSISVNTVKSVLRSVYTKLGALNRADAIRIATTRGLFKE
jgi:LuxR family maltose regulon positive regulatory protein